MSHFYTGKIEDKFCALCGSELKRVTCYNGTYDTKTGKRKTDNLNLCFNRSCFGLAPDDLMYAEVTK